MELKRSRNRDKFRCQVGVCFAFLERFSVLWLHPSPRFLSKVMAVLPATVVYGVVRSRAILGRHGFAVCSKTRVAEPSLLLKLKSDLKTAMRAKDSLRFHPPLGAKKSKF